MKKESLVALSEDELAGVRGLELIREGLSLLDTPHFLPVDYAKFLDEYITVVKEITFFGWKFSSEEWQYACPHKEMKQARGNLDEIQEYEMETVWSSAAKTESRNTGLPSFESNVYIKNYPHLYIEELEEFFLLLYEAIQQIQEAIHTLSKSRKIIKYRQNDYDLVLNVPKILKKSVNLLSQLLDKQQKSEIKDPQPIPSDLGEMPWEGWLGVQDWNEQSIKSALNMIGFPLGNKEYFSFSKEGTVHVTNKFWMKIESKPMKEKSVKKIQKNSSSKSHLERATRRKDFSPRTGTDDLEKLLKLTTLQVLSSLTNPQNKRRNRNDKRH